MVTAEAGAVTTPLCVEVTMEAIGDPSPELFGSAADELTTDPQEAA